MTVVPDPKKTWCYITKFLVCLDLVCKGGMICWKLGISYLSSILLHLPFYYVTLENSARKQKDLFWNMPLLIWSYKFGHQTETTACLQVPGGGGVHPRILDKGVPRRFVNPNPI